MVAQGWLRNSANAQHNHEITDGAAHVDLARLLLDHKARPAAWFRRAVLQRVRNNLVAVPWHTEAIKSQVFSANLAALISFAHFVNLRSLQLAHFSANGVFTLRGSYNKCQGRGLMRVCFLGLGIFPVHS